MSLIHDQRDLEQAHIEAKGETAFGSGPDDSLPFCHAFLQADRKAIVRTIERFIDELFDGPDEDDDTTEAADLA
ncbi:MAG: hypothetical protein HUJ26_18690 [Planctomycetaceae bacterium]|nr:hypothetical protein [Planctomycetaceae bacterium]